MAGAVVIVVKGYPRLSETFIAQEIRALELAGIDVRIVSLRLPTDKTTHPVHAEIRAPVHYLPEYLHQQPLRVLRAWWRCRRFAGYKRALTVWWKDVRRDFSANRVRRLGQAFVMATEHLQGVDHIHTHYLHTPASVTRYTSLMTGIGWSFSAHAKDIWTSPAWELREKLADCEWGVTCTKTNTEYLHTMTDNPGNVELVYHGLDFTRFPQTPPCRPARDGRDGDDPVVLLAVGRAVEKKGFDNLLDALVRLPTTLHWRLVHIGGGALLPALKTRAVQHGLEHRIQWLGALSQQHVIEHYLASDLFVLPCRVASDGDRDGLPNVLMEAQTLGLACISTRVSAVPEFIEDGVNGVLTPAGDIDALAAALARLMTEPATRLAMGVAGCARVRNGFSFQAGVDRVAERLRQSQRQDCR